MGRNSNIRSCVVRRLALLVMLIMWCEVYAQNITVTGDWYLSIDATDLMGGSGSDLEKTYKCANDQIILEISQSNMNWGVYVSAFHSNWPQDVQVGLLRTSNGKGPGWISGGTSWLTLTSFDQQFFIGYKQRRNINVKCRIRGMSVNVPAYTYSTTIIYTVTDI